MLMLAESDPLMAHAIRAVELSVQGGTETVNPYTTPESIEKITWDALDGTQGEFRIRIMRGKEPAPHETVKSPAGEAGMFGSALDEHFDVVWDEIVESVAEEFVIPTKLRDHLSENPGRYWYQVALRHENGEWGLWANRNYPRQSYVDWFYVNEQLTGYAWERGVSGWDPKKGPLPHPWGPGHHHFWGETSGSREFCIDKAGNLYITTSNRKAKTMAQGTLLVSRAGENSWKIVPLPEEGGCRYLPRCMAYDPTNNLVHLCCAYGGDRAFPANLYHIHYDPANGEFSRAYKIHPSGKGAAYQTPSMVVDETGVIHVAWYSSNVFGGKAFICYNMAKTDGKTPVWMEAMVSIDECVDTGFIPSLYAAPGRLHLFFTRTVQGTPIGHAHYMREIGDPMDEWRTLPVPFEKLGPYVGAFDHGAAVELLSNGQYRIHMVAPEFQPRGGNPRNFLYYSVFHHEPGWSDKWNEPETAFDVRNQFPCKDMELFEFASISVDSKGHLAAAFRVRKPGDGVDYLSSRNLVCWITKMDGKWEFSSEKNVLGDSNGGIGAYRPMFAKPDGYSAGFLHMIWAPGENFNWNGDLPDYGHPEAFNAYEDDSGWHHYYPIFHGLATKRLVFPF